MVSVRQRSADFFARYAIVDADRQGVTGPLGSTTDACFALYERFLGFVKFKAAPWDDINFRC